MGTPAGATKLGEYMYLFKAKTDAANCVIDAHGGFSFENMAFTVPQGVTIRFYCDHGATLADDGQEALKIAGNHTGYAAAETLHGGDSCQEYLLSKAWGRHTFGDDEANKQITYKSAKEFLTRNDGSRDAKLANQKKLALMQPDKTSQVTYDDLIGAVSVASLLSIRNRWDVGVGIPLSQAIRAARRAMPTLSTFHCCFCRSPMLPSQVGRMLGQTPEGPRQTATLT